MPKLSCYIFVACSDGSFIQYTLPRLCEMVQKVSSTPTIVVDASNPKGVLGEILPQSEFGEIINQLENIKRKHSLEVEVFIPECENVRKLSRIHFGKPYSETHCFRGYPIYGSTRQFHQQESDYVLHLDCDMIFYEEEGFSWIAKGISFMEEHEDILCVLPRGGPPANEGVLHQGTTYYKKDDARGIYLFKNFTSRHYLMHRKRFLGLLPIKPCWLSWREPIKSRLFGNGKMLCWETMVEKALKQSSLWRADLMTKKAWSLHPGERSKEFHEKLPSITKQVAKGHFPTAQAGHFDLRLEDWEVI